MAFRYSWTSLSARGGGLRVPPVRRAPQHRRTRLPPQARSAVYLPDVIPEQGWTQTEAIDSLIRKSGCEQPITEDLRASLEVSRFTSTRFSVPYERWAALRASLTPTTQREPPSMATHLSPSLVPPEMPSNRPPTGEETWRSRDEPGAPPSW